MNNDTIQNYENELYHYGVLGMKWGMRKARRTGGTYTYKSHAQKKYEKKVAKLEAKSTPEKLKKAGFSRKLKKAQLKSAMYKQRDRNRQDYAATTTMGSNIVKGLLHGPFGSGTYNRLRASGHGKFSSHLASNWVTGTLGYPVALLLSKNSENRAAKMMSKQNR